MRLIPHRQTRVLFSWVLAVFILLPMILFWMVLVETVTRHHHSPSKTVRMKRVISKVDRQSKNDFDHFPINLPKNVEFADGNGDFVFNGRRDEQPPALIHQHDHEEDQKLVVPHLKDGVDARPIDVKDEVTNEMNTVEEGNKDETVHVGDVKPLEKKSSSILGVEKSNDDILINVGVEKRNNGIIVNGESSIADKVDNDESEGKRQLYFH